MENYHAAIGYDFLSENVYKNFNFVMLSGTDQLSKATPFLSNTFVVSNTDSLFDNIVVPRTGYSFGLLKLTEAEWRMYASVNWFW